MSSDRTQEAIQETIHVIGGGLSGSEAAWQIAALGVPVVLHEMRPLNSLVMRSADGNQVPAGGALAVDRDGFSAVITAAIAGHPLIEVVREEVATLPPDWDSVIVATGPLTSPALA